MMSKVYDKIRFFKAHDRDSEFLFSLRNDPVVRENSINSEEIKFTDHKIWFEKSLKDDKRKIYVFTFEDKKAGQIRFDLKEKGIAEISISIIKDFRGKGIGYSVLRKACNLAFEGLRIKKILAKIKESNISSMKIFDKAGFSNYKEDKNVLYLKLEKIKKGIKLWTKNDRLFGKADELYKNGKIDFVELYIMPNTYEKTIDKLKQLSVPFILHCMHASHGFNPGNKGISEENLKMFQEVKKFAKDLNSKDIIIHPEHGDYDESVDFIKRLDYTNLIIENMPKKGLNDEKMLGYSVDQIREYLRITKGFCLDLSHAIKACKSLNQDLNDYIVKLLEFKPFIIHICDGNKDVEIDQHLDLGEGDFDLRYLKYIINKSDAKYITFETPKKDRLENDLKNIQFYDSI